MRRNGFRDDEPLAGVKAKAFGDAAREMSASLALLAQNLEGRSLAKMNAGLERVDGETNRPEPSAKIPGEIEKPEMQARRRRDLNAFQLRRLFSSIHPPSGARNSIGTLRNFACFAKQGESLCDDGSPAGDLIGAARDVCGRGSDQIAMLRALIQNATVP